MHTNFDKAEGGVNDVLAELLELTNITNLAPGKLSESIIFHSHQIFFRQ